ncbi:hypothetical protein JXA80_11305 [bacterium]|nr:hypothetical protein [candidate division CSSED10-310 bacterium]
MRRDLEWLAGTYLGEFHSHVLIRSGNPVDTLISTAVKNRCDLIILHHAGRMIIPFHSRRLRIKSILKRSPIPILLLPTIESSPPSRIPVSSVLLHVHPEEKNRLASAFACRCARLLNASTYLVTTCRSPAPPAVSDALTFLRDRYWPQTPDISCKISVLPEKKPLALTTFADTIKADMVILTANAWNPSAKLRLIDRVKSLCIDPNRSLLWVHRRDWVNDLEKKMNAIYMSISDFDRVQTAAGETDALSLPLPSHSGTHIPATQPLLLGLYSVDGLLDVLGRYGLLRSLMRRGYPQIGILFETTDQKMERLRIFPDQRRAGEPLVDLVFRRESNPVFPGAPSEFPAHLGPYLHIQWLCLQDPERIYRDLEIPLPGQRFPGLGLGWKVMIILKLLARRIGAAGVYNMPEYYHTARMYHRFFRYVDPMLEGRLLALDRDTFPLHLVDTSWAFLHGLVTRNTEPCQWIGGPQILPLHPDLLAYFQSRDYTAATHEHMHQFRFAIDLDRMKTMIDNHSLYRDPGEHSGFMQGGFFHE